MTRALITWILAAAAALSWSQARATAAEPNEADGAEDNAPPKRKAKSNKLPPVSGYFDTTFTVPIQYRKLALALPPGSDGELGVLAQRSLITTLEVDVPVAKHWRLVARPSAYNVELIDPILGVEYERTARNWTVSALQYATLPISVLSRESGRVTTLGEAFRLGYQKEQWSPYVLFDASYSWFSNALAASKGETPAIQELGRPVPVDQDTIAVGTGVQRYLNDDQWMLSASINVERLHFHDRPLPALWSTSLQPIAATFYPAEGVYVDASVLLIQQAKLVIWPDEPLFYSVAECSFKAVMPVIFAWLKDSGLAEARLMI